MSLAKLARASRIDSFATSLGARANRITTLLNTLADDVNEFAVFMHSDPGVEFTQEDRDKYSASFVAELTSIQTVMARFGPLAQLDADLITKEQFLALYNIDANAYSTKFDRG